MKFRKEHQIHPRHRVRRFFMTMFLLIIVLGIAGTAALYRVYKANLQPVSSDKTAISVTIAPGSTNAQIADLLESKKVIRSDWTFEWYLRVHEPSSSLKAGTYSLSADKSVPDIIAILSGGKVSTKLVTILPGKRLDQVRTALIDSGFTPQEVDAALEPSQYQDHPALSGKPPSANLEGYLYPDSFQKTAGTTAQDIIRLSLDEMNRYLTPDLRESFAAQGLTPHQAVIISSIVEQEVSNAADRPQVAQVFLKRYKTGMQLGSDVTAFYGSRLANHEPDVTYDSPYNTRIHAGLPPGPISNISASSLQAVAFPAPTDWLYFVAGDDGTTHFSKTNAEHEALTRQYCIKLCQ